MGSCQLGYNLPLVAWPGAVHCFEIDDYAPKILKCSGRPSVTGFSGSISHTPPDILLKCPVDLFVVDHTRDLCKDHPTDRWIPWVQTCSLSARPPILVQLWHPDSLLQADGPMSKPARKRLSHLGYTSRCELLSNLRCGGVVDQQRFGGC
jgi:hypothetical protein